MQRSLKLPQVHYINKIIQKVQQITEVSQQQYMTLTCQQRFHARIPPHIRTS